MKKSEQRKRVLRAIFCILILGIVCYVYQSSVIPAFMEVKNVASGLFLEVLLLSAVYYLGESIVTYLMVQDTKDQFTYWQALKTYFYACFYRAVSFGSGGGIAEIYYLTKHKVNAGRATGISLLKYAFHRLSILGYCGVLILMNQEFCRSCFHGSAGYVIGGFIFLALLAFLLFLVCLSNHLNNVCIQVLDWAGRRYPKITGRTEQLKVQLNALQEEARYILKKPQKVVAILVVDVVKFTALYSIPYLLIRQSGLSFLQGLTIMTAAITLAGVFPVPGGLGSIEFVLTMLFGGIISEAKVLAAVVVFRFVYYIMPFVIGGIGLISLKAGKKWIAGEKRA